MSMTLEEAIKNREECLRYLEDIGAKATPSCVEAVRWSVKALKALRPITREQVEKAWGGCYLCRGTTKMIGLAYAEGPSEIVKGEKFQAAYVGKFGSDGKDEFCKLRFCPACGRPLTDKAVDMVMERLEEICK